MVNEHFEEEHNAACSARSSFQSRLARERLPRQGQQTRCDSGADGIVRMRESGIFRWAPSVHPSCIPIDP